MGKDPNKVLSILKIDLLMIKDTRFQKKNKNMDGGQRKNF